MRRKVDEDVRLLSKLLAESLTTIFDPKIGNELRVPLDGRVAVWRCVRIEKDD